VESGAQALPRNLFTVHHHLFVEFWGRSRPETSSGSHTPQYSSQYSSLGVDMENARTTLSPFVFKAKKL